MTDTGITGGAQGAGSSPENLDVGLSFPPGTTPATSLEPAIVPTETSQPKDIHADIEKILKEIKLPERRDFKAAKDVVKTAPPAPLPEPLKEPVTIPVDQTERHEVSISRVHTLKEDLQKAVKINKMSLVRAVALEEDKQRRKPEPLEENPIRVGRRKRVVGVLFTSVLLLLLGAAALISVYFVALGHGTTTSTTSTSLVFSEQTFPVVITGSNAATIKQSLAKLREEPSGSLGSITRIKPVVQHIDAQGASTERLATTAEFFSAIDANPPDELVHALGEEFFFGFHIVDKNAPVLVIPITSYDHAFAGMLAWESAINADLSPIFISVPPTIVDQNGIPSSRVFKDDVMRNYDVRELKDDRGAIELYYSFPTPKLLIIAESPYSFPEILSRLQSERKI